MSDEERILDYLRKYGSMTRADAFIEFGCANPTARISDLRKRGYDILTVTETGLDRYGEPSRWGRWVLREDNNGTRG